MPYDSVGSLPANVKKLPAKRRRQWRDVWNSTYKSCKAGGGSDAACESKAFRNANGVVKGAEMANAATHKAHEGMSPIQLEKADKRVDYRVAAEGDKGCADCRFFCQAGMHCMLVEGTIDGEWVCNLWTAELPGQQDPSGLPGYDPSHSYHDKMDYQIFYDASSVFADADFTKPMWIPFLPEPGVYKHPKYGELDITKVTNAAFVKSVKDHVYQEQIPMDAEHETKLSGAVGWISDMRQNENGSADAYVEWTDRGQKLLEGGQFKYVSPEWFSSWRDPATEVVHENVIAGGAITTRPFFKDKVLRALVASEEGGEVIAPDSRSGSEGDRHMPDPTKEKDPQGGNITLTETQLDARINAAVKTAREEDATKFTELEAKVTAAEALAATEKTAREAATTRLETMEKAARDRRFRDMIAGTGGSNDGASWVGDAEGHLAVLIGMSDAGIDEDSETFKKFVEGQNAVAAQAKEANLFGVIGSSGAGQAGDNPEAKIEALAQARMKEDAKLSHAQAYTEAISSPEGRKLYEQIGTPQKTK